MHEWLVQYWLEALFALALGGIGSLVGYVLKASWALKLGVQAMLRNDIIDLYNKCTSRPEPYIKIYELQNMEELYKQYHSLHGNGMAKHLYEEFLDLPLEQVVKK